MAFDFENRQKNNQNRSVGGSAGAGQKNAVTAIIAVMAALVVFHVGQSLGMVLVQLTLPLFLPELYSVSESAAEEMLSQPMMGVTLQEVLGTILSLSMQAVGGLLCWVLWRKELYWKLRLDAQEQENQVSRPRWMKGILFCAATICGCLGLNLVMNGLQITLFSEAFMEVATDQASVPIVLGVLMYGFVSPLAEEIVFRGVIYRKLRNTFGVSKALLLAAIFFAIYHGNIIQGIYAALIGVVLCYLYEKSGSLWMPVVFHGIGNLAVYLLIGVGGVMELMSNALACVLGVVLTGLAVGALYLYFGKPDFQQKKQENYSGE